MAEHRFEVVLPAPLDLAASLERFARFGDDLLDRFDGATLLRTVRAGGRAVAVACTLAGDVAAPRLAVSVADAADEAAARAGLRGMFAAEHEALARLAAADPAIARLALRYPGVVAVLERDPFTALVRSITAQQVNLRWAGTTRARIARAFGREHHLHAGTVYSLEPEPLAAASVEELRALQLTTAKSRAIVALAGTLASGGLDLAALAGRPDDEVTATLCALPGIGRWTADWYLARCLGRARVVAGDLGVRKAVGALYAGGKAPSEEEVRELTAHWGDAAVAAQALALHALATGGLAAEPVPEAAP